MVEVHAKYAPSGAHRYLNCSGCIALCEPFPEEPSSDYALEGSAAHLLGSRCLEADIMPTDKIGSEIECEGRIFPVTEEMALAVQVYVDEILRKRASMPRGYFLVEKRLSIDWIDPELFGTGDHIAVDPLVRVCVDDYKHGAGVSVDVEENPQLMIYGLGALGKGNPNMVDTVELTIIQPRAPHAAGPIRSWEIKADDLIAWGDDVLIPGIAKTKQPFELLEFKAGEWCRWCPALKAMDINGKELCPAIRTQRKAMIETMFGDNAEVSKPDQLSPAVTLPGEKLDWILEREEIFLKGIEAFKAEAVRRLKIGAQNAPKRFKLVKGKSSRDWADEAAIVGFLRGKHDINPYNEPLLKSPAQMETSYKLAKLDTTELGKFIDKKEGKPKLVPVAHSGKALRPEIEAMFPDELDPFRE